MTRGGSRQTSLTGRVGTRRTGLLPLWPHQWAWWCLWLVLSFRVGIYWKGLQHVGAAQRKFCRQICLLKCGLYLSTVELQIRSCGHVLE